MSRRKLSPELKRLVKEKEELIGELDNLDVWWKAFIPKYRSDLQRVTVELDRNFNDTYIEVIRLTRKEINR